MHVTIQTLAARIQQLLADLRDISPADRVEIVRLLGGPGAVQSTTREMIADAVRAELQRCAVWTVPDGSGGHKHVLLRP